VAEIDAALPVIRTAPGPVLYVAKVRAEPLPFALPPKDGAYLKDRFRHALLGAWRGFDLGGNRDPASADPTLAGGFGTVNPTPRNSPCVLAQEGISILD